MTRTVIAAVGVTVLAAASVGCGATHSAPLTASAYKSRVNAACATFTAHTDALAMPLPSDRQAVIRYAAAFIPYLRAEANQLAALTPPTRYRSFHEGILAALRTALARETVLLPKFKSGQVTFNQLLNDRVANEADNRASALFTNFNAPACLP